MSAVDTYPMHQHLRDPVPTPRGAWLGVLAAPIAWSLQLALGWWVSGNTCADGTPAWGPLSGSAVRLVQMGIGAAALAVAVLGLVAAWRTWRRNSGEPPALTAIRGEQRVGFMAGAGVLTSGVFLFAIVLTGVANAVVSVCEFMR